MAAVVAEQLKRRQSGFWDPPLGHGQAAASRMGRQGTRKQRPLTKRVSGPVRGRGVSQSRCPPAPRLRPGRGKLSQDRVAFHRTRLGRQQCDLANRSLPGPQARSAQRGDRASSPARPAAVGTEGACMSNALGARRSGGLRAPWLLPVHTSSPTCSAVRSRPRRPLYHETARAPRTRLAEGHGLVRGGVYVTPSAPGSSRCELCEPVLQGALRSRAEGDRATLSWLHALLPPTAPELQPRARGPSTDFFLFHFYRGPHTPIDDRKVTKLPHDKVILHDKNQLETDPDVQS